MYSQPGKALYTTIRELVENSLDAAESISNLPDITLVVEEMNESELNTWRGLENRDRVDVGLFKTAGPKVGTIRRTCNVTSVVNFQGLVHTFREGNKQPRSPRP